MNNYLLAVIALLLVAVFWSFNRFALLYAYDELWREMKSYYLHKTLVADKLRRINMIRPVFFKAFFDFKLKSFDDFFEIDTSSKEEQIECWREFYRIRSNYKSYLVSLQEESSSATAVYEENVDSIQSPAKSEESK